MHVYVKYVYRIPMAVIHVSFDILVQGPNIFDRGACLAPPHAYSWICHWLHSLFAEINIPFPNFYQNSGDQL